MYTREMKILASEINDSIWRQTLQFIWLNLHFIYRGKRRKHLFANGPWLERAYGYFMREMVGTPLTFLTRSGWFFKVATYIDDLYPDFLENDPFKNPELYKFPYKTATIDFMYFVYQMPHRLELLRIAEEQEMNYDQFVDYVINYVMTENEGDPRKVQYKVMRMDAPTDAPYIGYDSYRPLRARYMKTPARWRNKKHG